MRIVQITPGAGGMYCGNCFRDNTLVAELRRAGHEVLMIPLYLPMTLEDEDQSSGIPIFFSGVAVYLEQKVPFLGKVPGFVHDWLASPKLLRWAGKQATSTRPSELGDITLSMLRGEEGKQEREIAELVRYLKHHERPEVVSLSNALLVGMVRALKRELNVPVVCNLQGEDSFLDSLPESHRQITWQTLAERCRDVDLFVAPTQYFAELMGRRLNLPREKVRVIYNGLQLEGWEPARSAPEPPALGFFARMCREKGLHTLVETFALLKKRDRVKNLKLHVGGAMGPRDEIFVNELKLRLQGEGILGDVTFFSNITREQKQQFFRRISVLSVPAEYGESFGLYLVESWAAAVPVVQPPVAAFSELIEVSGGGVLARSTAPTALADSIEELLLNPQRRETLGRAGRSAVERRFNSSAMAAEMIDAFSVVNPASVPAQVKSVAPAGSAR